MVYGVQGSFDSVNPFIIKGAPVAGVNTLVFDTLMRRSADEPFSYYPLIASPSRRLTIDPGSSSGSTPGAILGRSCRHRRGCGLHLDLLRTRGRPNTRASYTKVTKVEIKDQHTIRFESGRQ